MNYYKHLKIIHLDQKIKPPENKQLDLFLNANPILLDLKQLDLNLLTPLEALNKLHEWQERNSNQDPNK